MQLRSGTNGFQGNVQSPSQPLASVDSRRQPRPVNCNLCGADDAEIVFPRGYAQLHQIVRCRRCGLMYANPQEHVDCDEFAGQGQDEVYDPESPRHYHYFQKQLTQLPDNERALRVLNSVFPKRGKLLEIGSFAGVFLDRIRATGWEVTGLEPDRPVGQYARSKYGLEIVEGVLPNPALGEASFDAVLLQHVIEHMPDPAANLREIRRLLRVGGVFVVETPRFNSLLFKVLGRRERSVQNCPGHIYFFTEKTLRALLERQGFKVFRTERVGRTLTWDRFLGNLGLVARNRGVYNFFGRVSKRFGLERFRLYVNFRDMQRMYARAV
jgi:SAM-dependent methyltransferase